jgi:hypothetical protein
VRPTTSGPGDGHRSGDAAENGLCRSGVGPIASLPVVIEVLMIVGVVLLPLPALALGCLRLLSRTGRASMDDRTDRLEFALVVAGRLIGLLLLFALSGITLLSCIGGIIKDLRVPSLVYVFFVADLLVASLVVLTVGRRGPQPARRRGNPARR